VDGDRRLRGQERPNRRILLVWLALSALILLAAVQRITEGQFPDPDDALRLVQVRDLLTGQTWFDTSQYRIDPPGGSPMHWSRLVDIPLAAMIVLLAPLLGQAGAEQAALIAIPLLTFATALWFIGRLAWRLQGKEAATYALLVCGFMPALLFQFQPLRIDHHGWQIVSVCAALWALAFRKPHQGGAVAGIAMAVGLSISIEILPMAATFAAVLFLRWLRDHHARWWLVAYLQALAIGLGLIFLLTRGLRDLAQHCDAVSPAHIGFFLVVALGVGAIGWRSRATNLALIAWLGLAGAAAVGFFALSSPGCVTTPFGSLDPLVTDFWYIYVMEGQPYWRQQQAQAVPVLVQLLVGLAAALALRARSKDWLRAWWTDYAVLLAGALLLSLFVWRSAAFASAIAAIPLGWLLAGLLARFRHAQGATAKVGAVALIVLLLAPSTPLFLQRKLVPLEDETQVTHVEESGCAIREQAAKLDQLAPATLFAPLDIGPAILVKSRHAVVATGHHRAESAMHDVIAAFTSDPETARKIVGNHGGDYIVLCSDLVEPRLYASANPEGLMARLLAGTPPDWLEPVAFDGPQEFRIWKVRSEPGVTPE
jgi:MFS family permease